MFEIRPYNRKNTISTFNPFREMEDFERSFFSNPFGFFDNRALAEFKTDISDIGDAYLLETDLPGFAKEDIHLDLDGDTLTLRAERHSACEDKEKKDQYIRCERSYGAYSRTFDVSMVDVDRITAKYENGVLSLTLPKKNETTPPTKSIAIQ